MSLLANIELYVVNYFENDVFFYSVRSVYIYVYIYVCMYLIDTSVLCVHNMYCIPSASGIIFFFLKIDLKFDHFRWFHHKIGAFYDSHIWNAKICRVFWRYEVFNKRIYIRLYVMFTWGVLFCMSNYFSWTALEYASYLEFVEPYELLW